MRVVLDRDRDIAYIELEDARTPHPEGGSNMLLPPWFPFEVHLYYDGTERLVGVQIKDASRRLHPDALEKAVPFEPFPPRVCMTCGEEIGPVDEVLYERAPDNDLEVRWAHGRCGWPPALKN